MQRTPVMRALLAFGGGCPLMNAYAGTLFAALTASTLLSPDPGRTLIIGSFAGGGGSSTGPHELFNAQGFPPDYKIDGFYHRTKIGHNGGPQRVPFSKSVQVSCVGNSVCPPAAKALVTANCNHLAVERERIAA